MRRLLTDAHCAGAYSDFDPQTMVCAGFPQGGVYARVSDTTLSGWIRSQAPDGVD
jgi:hypothetical protein